MTRPLNPLITTPAVGMPKRVAVLGAGTIGPDIGYYLKSALPNLELVLVDVNQAPLDSAQARINAYVRKGLERGKLSPQLAEQVPRGWEMTTDYQDIAACDWVIEAVTENLALKRRIFSDVENIVGPQALITSNTSSLPAATLFDHLQNPARTSITHFFAPAWRNPIVEIVDWDQSDPTIIDRLRWILCMTGKVPLVTADVVCFMLDRVFDNWCNEAATLLDDATPAQIDTVAQEFVAAGPFFVLNMANGNPIIIETNTLQADAEGEHYRPAAALGRDEPWQTVAPGEEVGVAAALREKIRTRLLGILMSQSVDILDRRIGAAADLDLGCRLALGFSRGPLELMRKLGADSVDKTIADFVAQRPGMPAPRQPIGSYAAGRRFVLVDDIDGVKLITIRRPEALNALHDELNDEILDALESHREAPGFVIAGYGDRAFSAGADIGRFPEVLGNAAAAVDYAKSCSKLLAHLDRIEQPVVAAINGMALGGGLELAMRCHALVAVNDAFLQFPEITLGIVPGIGGMVVPYRRWPTAAKIFHGMLREARRLSAREAHELGIINTLAPDYAALIAIAVQAVRNIDPATCRVVDDPVNITALPATDATAATGQALSREVLAILDAAIVGGAAQTSFADALATGYRAFGETACTAAARAGIEAFMNNRKPDFTATG